VKSLAVSLELSSCFFSRPELPSWAVSSKSFYEAVGRSQHPRISGGFPGLLGSFVQEP